MSHLSKLYETNNVNMGCTNNCSGTYLPFHEPSWKVRQGEQQLKDPGTEQIRDQSPSRSTEEFLSDSFGARVMWIPQEGLTSCEAHRRVVGKKEGGEEEKEEKEEKRRRDVAWEKHTVMKV
ncbi:unnamed protein product [Pleuronectes platessa]|uniref:Uncharacterized protein n=1 Tax=Pleuronectes platessa TaxID=8262 RepID=A0A9N7YC97_PLEPL|nr:unnamed protein product [Pleuronectes platessa]